jgi:Cu+-exporting ATPase
MFTLKLPVYGMNCAGCAGRLKIALNEIEGIAAEVNFSLNQALLSFDEINDHSQTLAHVLTLLENKNYQTDTQTHSLSIVGWSCAGCMGKTVKQLEAQPFTFNVLGNFATETIQFQSIEGVVNKKLIEEFARQTSYQITLQSKQNIKQQRIEKALQNKKQDQQAGNTLRLSLALTFPFFISMIIMTITGEHHFLPAWLEFSLASVVQFYIGARFYKGAFNSLKDRSANMDVLV